MGEVRILGPIEVVVSDRPVAIGSLQLRRLLAALAVHADKVVSTDRLVDILWGDAAPRQASSTLAKSVYRLRSLLDDRAAGGRLIVTQPSGYALLVDGQLDAHQFASRVTDAKAHMSGADPAGARRLLDDALALWRGSALGEFADEEFARAEATRLEELRATAREDRGDIDLTLGQHVELLDELHRSIEAYPLRERFRAQLMLAMYRAGRQPEALRAYQDFRTMLLDELGLEPSRELRELDQAIAQRGSRLDWTASPKAVRTSLTSSTTHNLPSGTVTFVFTDIEHSTQLLRQLGPAYPEALERQRTIIRRDVASHDGVEVNVEGDGMLFAFGSARSAMSACVEVQRALLGERWPEGVPLRVRMGVHTGEAVPTDGDYTALCLHEAARIVACAHGAQIIVSGVTVHAAEPGAEAPTVRALGRFVLRDFPLGVELFQLLDPALPSDFPPPRQELDVRVNTPLPAELLLDRSPFVGRRTDLEWLDTLWFRVQDGQSCVGVLSGPEGAGKSRLLAEFARRAHALGAAVVAPHGPADLIGLLASVPGGSLTIVVVDQLDDDGIVGAVSTALSTRHDLSKLVLAATCANEGLDDRLTDVMDDPAAFVTRALEPLDAVDIAAMLTDGEGPPPSELVDGVLGETAGWPGAATAVVANLRERRTAQRVERALQRAENVRAELQTIEDDLAADVLRLGRTTPATRPAASGTCPYKGLSRFEVADADYFFGRDRLIASLVASLATSAFIGIVGASGSGKSSLARAGLLAALGRDSLPGSSAWPVHVLRPGGDPVGRLEREFGGLDLDAAARREVASLPAGTRMVIVVDQFEEMFTVCADDEARTAFIDALTDLEVQDSPAVVVLTLRADYYGACAAHPALARLLERNQVLVGAMSPPELRAAIVEPAHRVGLMVEPALVDTIVRDVADQPGMLPLVSTALLETWTFTDGATMSVGAYERAGGVQGALARLADRTYDSFAPDEQAAVRRAFLRLAQLGEGNDDVSRRAARRELGSDRVTNVVVDVLITARLLTADESTVEVAHEALLREWPRLRGWLEQDRDGRRIHRHLTDAALQWDADGRDPSALYRGARLGNATEWATTHDDDVNELEREFLDASVELDQQEVRRTRHVARRLRELAVGLSILLVVALAAGTLALVQRHNADHQATVADATARRAQASRLAILAKTLGTGQNDLALLLGLEAHALDPSVETEGGLESALVHVPPGVEQITDTGTQIAQATSSYDGRNVLLAHNDGTVDIRDITTGKQIVTLHGSTSPALVAHTNANGNLGVVGHANGQVEVFDTTTGNQTGTAFDMGPELAWGSFATPDGTRLMTINQVPTSEHSEWQGVLWDRSDPNHPHTVGDPFVFPIPAADFQTGGAPLAFVTADGTEFVAGSFYIGTTYVWDIASHEQIATLPIRDVSPWPPADRTAIAGVTGDRIVFVDRRTGAQQGDAFPALGDTIGPVTVSADGRWIATTPAVSDGRVVVYDAGSRRQVGEVRLQAGARAVEFLTDGRLVISAGTQVILWRPGVTVPPIGTSLGQPDGPVQGLFTEDGQTVVTFHSSALTPADAPVYAFDALTGAPKGELASGHTQHYETGCGQQLAVNPDATIVAAPRAGGVHLVDATTGTDLSVLNSDRPADLLCVVWSPTGDRIATYGVDQDAVLWDVSDPRRPRVSGPPLVMPGTPFVSPPNLQAEFSRDGRSFLLADEPHGAVAVFDVATGAQRWLDHFAGFPLAGRIGYTSGDEVVMSNGSGAGHVISALDAATGQSVRTFPLTDAGVADLLRGGSVLMVSGTANAGDSGAVVIRLYDTASGAQLGEPLPVGTTSSDVTEQGAYFQVSASFYVNPDGTRLLSGAIGPGATVTLWDVDLSDWETMACRIAGRNLTRAEWDQYLADRPYRVTCPQWPTGT